MSHFDTVAQLADKIVKRYVEACPFADKLIVEDTQTIEERKLYYLISSILLELLEDNY